jgi:hypothetical protein
MYVFIHVRHLHIVSSRALGFTAIIGITICGLVGIRTSEGLLSDGLTQGGSVQVAVSHHLRVDREWPLGVTYRGGGGANVNLNKAHTYKKKTIANTTNTTLFQSYQHTFHNCMF